MTSGLGIGVIAALVIALLGRLLIIGLQLLDLSIAADSALQLGWLVFCVSLWLWVVVGIWRSASFERPRTKWMARVALLSATALLMPIGFRSAKAAGELVSLVQGRDPMGPPASIERKYEQLVLTGVLAQGTASVFERVLSQGAVGVVVLDSPGGRVAEALSVAKLVREHNLDTVVDGECESACTMILASGRNRSMYANSRVGFHQSTFSGNAKEDDEIDTESVRAYFRDRGVSEDFISTAFSTSPTSMWYPTESQMIAAGVLNSARRSPMLDQPKKKTSHEPSHKVR